VQIAWAEPIGGESERGKVVDDFHSFEPEVDQVSRADLQGAVGQIDRFVGYRPGRRNDCAVWNRIKTRPVEISS
jgi:hypothetical protein